MGRSKTKHLRTGKKYLIHSLVMLDFLTLGLFPIKKGGGVEGGREHSLKRQLEDKVTDNFLRKFSRL